MLVADLLRQNIFPDFKLVGGNAGLQHEITSVSVIDAPDVDRWMRGGELLVGSGYIFKTKPAELIPFMTRAANKKVAALGIKLDRYHHNLQDRVIQHADRIALPLFLIPLHYRWTDINETVYRQIEQEKTERLLAAGEAPASHFGGIENFWQEGIDITKTLSHCAVILDRTVIVSSGTLGIRHVFHPSGEIERPNSLTEHMWLPAIEQHHLPARGQVAARMEFRDSPPEWQAVYNLTGAFPLTIRLVLKGTESTPSVAQERVVLRAISLLRATYFEKETYAQDSGAQRERFFEGLCLDIYNDEEMISSNLEELKVTLPPLFRVMIAVSGDNPPFEGWTPPQAPLCYRLGQFWTGLIPSREGPDEKKHLESLKTGKGKGLYFALGSLIRHPGETSRSYQEASRMLAWIRASDLPPDIYLHEEFCLYSLFDSLGRLPESKSVWKRYWEPLKNKTGSKRSLSYTELAEALISSDFNAKRCSEKLHLHYNTVRNYIDELEAYLNVKITDQYHRIGIMLASFINRSMDRK